MNISILCTDPKHPILAHLRQWCDSVRKIGHDARIFVDRNEVDSGDILFLVSCAQIVSLEIRQKFLACLVLHASELPQGRGWSPHIWSILSGATEITVCLLEAGDRVDTGDIWLREVFRVNGHELLPEINEKLFRAELSLMSRALDQFGEVEPTPQHGEAGPHLRRRTPDDSRIDPCKTIAEQFDLLRVADAERFPAFMDYRGHRYFIRIEKACDHE